jgi:hypothetical protein
MNREGNPTFGSTNMGEGEAKPAGPEKTPSTPQPGRKSDDGWDILKRGAEFDIPNDDPWNDPRYKRGGLS